MYQSAIRKRLFRVIVATLLLLPILSFAQPVDTRHKVDTLSLADRISFRTNGTDWVMMVPNIGVEFDIRNKNWNRWAVNLNFRYRPSTNSNVVVPLVFEGKEIKLEGRMYWRERQAQSSGVMAYHFKPWDKLMSCRRMIPKHFNTVYYRGVYVSYGDYSFRLKGMGHAGKAAQVGITWGFVRPLYAYGNGNSIDFELGVSGGAALVKSHRFQPDYDNNVYRNYSYRGKHIVPVLNDIHAALVYRLGNYPIQKKYRWRYDVDMDFRARKDSAWARNEADAILKHHRDSMFRVVSRDFRLTYDSVIAVRRKEKQEKIDKAAPARIETSATKRKLFGSRKKNKVESQSTALLKKEEE